MGCSMVNNEVEKIYLDQEGYNSLLEELEMLKQELDKNYLEKGEAYSGSVGDGWHDNFAFEEANRQERMLLYRIKECTERLKNAVIVNKTNNDKMVDIGDVINVDIIFAEDDIDNCWIELVGSINSESRNGIQKVSINSPLGKVIYHKQVGDKVSYIVNQREVPVLILSKEDQLSKKK